MWVKGDGAVNSSFIWQLEGFGPTGANLNGKVVFGDHVQVICNTLGELCDMEPYSHQEVDI